MAFIGQGAWTKGTEGNFPTNTSGHVISGIPSTATKVRIKFDDMKTSGNGYFYLRVGHSGGIEANQVYKGNSNYHYYGNSDSTGSALDDRIGISTTNWDHTQYIWHGFIELEKIKSTSSSKKWMYNNSVFESNGGYWSSHRIMYEGRGFVPLGSNDLDRVVMYATAGNFSQGSYILDYLV
tara:strand:- start:1272 stop:1811 length:540 start_codon:yes stop_codon:yes gene_type:complete